MISLSIYYVEKGVLNPSSIVNRENISLRKFNRYNGEHWELQYEEQVKAKILSFIVTLAKSHNVTGRLKNLCKKMRNGLR